MGLIAGLLGKLIMPDDDPGGIIDPTLIGMGKLPSEGSLSACTMQRSLDRMNIGTIL